MSNGSVARQQPALPDRHQLGRDRQTSDRAEVQAWLDAYVDAWRSYDPVEIADLWGEDAVWCRPFGI